MRRPRSLTPGLLAVLGFLSAVGPLATDMYLASFTDMTGDLRTDAPSVQLTLTAFLAGMGAGQLVLGPLSDRWGRRAVLLTAVSLFAATSVAMVFTPSIEVLIGLRLLQGFAGAGSVVIARAIAADLSTGATAVRALSLIATVGALGPVVAPPIGGLIAPIAGWRGVLAALALAAVLMLALATVVVPESLPPESRHTGTVLSVFRRFGQLARDASFTAYVVVFGLGFTGMMAYIAASPFVGQVVLGLSPLLYSLSFAAGGVALVCVNLVNARVAPRVGPERMLLIGVAATLTAGAAMTALAATGALSAALFIAYAFVITGGAGLIMSNASALALARTGPTSRGAGAALLGATQFALGGSISPIVGLWGEGTALPMAVVGTCAAAAALVCALVARSRH
ncbi:Bcr/CflA family efflux MFS transporter [Microbacterium sp. dk485]|uniref:multidrug effflux MFS transporter n=1 Tax=Microbacterium sp. dk485 TaxID=2560021 RepID=UPI001073C360|nr:multidrug effflux MFS transporter [Microbacterium sp. dk485]TFV85321.1 Bcr/CflA family efflux MFS transporter [Microbacterium sp. dk485]